MLVMKMKNNEIEKNILLLTRKSFFTRKWTFFLIRGSFFREICPKIHQTRKFLSNISRFFWHAKVSARESFCF